MNYRQSFFKAITAFFMAMILLVGVMPGQLRANQSLAGVTEERPPGQIQSPTDPPGANQYGSGNLDQPEHSLDGGNIPAPADTGVAVPAAIEETQMLSDLIMPFSATYTPSNDISAKATAVIKLYKIESNGSVTEITESNYKFDSGSYKIEVQWELDSSYIPQDGDYVNISFGLPLAQRPINIMDDDSPSTQTAKVILVSGDEKQMQLVFNDYYNSINKTDVTGELFIEFHYTAAGTGDSKDWDFTFGSTVEKITGEDGDPGVAPPPAPTESDMGFFYKSGAYDENGQYIDGLTPPLVEGDEILWMIRLNLRNIDCTGPNNNIDDRTDGMEADQKLYLTGFMKAAEANGVTFTDVINNGHEFTPWSAEIRAETANNNYYTTADPYLLIFRLPKDNGESIRSMDANLLPGDAHYLSPAGAKLGYYSKASESAMFASLGDMLGGRNSQQRNNGVNPAVNYLERIGAAETIVDSLTINGNELTVEFSENAFSDNGGVDNYGAGYIIYYKTKFTESQDEYSNKAKIQAGSFEQGREVIVQGASHGTSSGKNDEITVVKRGDDNAKLAAAFEVYIWDGQDASQKPSLPDRIVTTSASTGKVKIPLATYLGESITLVETGVPSGYRDENIQFTLEIGANYAVSLISQTPAGAVELTSATGNNKEVVVTNKKEDTLTKRITIKKVGIISDLLKGAEFTFTGPSGAATVYDLSELKNNGEITLSLLDGHGVYTLTETAAPTGYNKLIDKVEINYKADETISLANPGALGSHVALDEENGVVTITVKNSKPPIENTKGSFNIVKTDGANRLTVPVDFALQRKVNDNFESILSPITLTGESYSIELASYGAGTYRLIEISTPQGYVDDASYITFDIITGGRIDYSIVHDERHEAYNMSLANGAGSSTFQFTAINHIKMDPEKSYFRVIKTDGVNLINRSVSFTLQRVLEDGYIKAYGPFSFSSGVSNNIDLSQFEEGEYRLIESSVPQGYENNPASMTFRIEKNGHDKLVVVRNHYHTSNNMTLLEHGIFEFSAVNTLIPPPTDEPEETPPPAPTDEPKETPPPAPTDEPGETPPPAPNQPETVYDPDLDAYYVMNENGTPLGYVKVPEGKTIDDMNLVDDLIPMAGFKVNPQTAAGQTLRYTSGIAFLIIGFREAISLFSSIKARSRQKSQAKK